MVHHHVREFYQEQYIKIISSANMKFKQNSESHFFTPLKADKMMYSINHMTLN